MFKRKKYFFRKWNICGIKFFQKNHSFEQEEHVEIEISRTEYKTNNRMTFYYLTRIGKSMIKEYSNK